MSSETADLPQANSLAKVRAFVDIVASGRAAYANTAGAAIGLSPRHAAYYGTAARVTLRLLAATRGRLALTPIGFALVSTRPGSFEERSILARALRESESVTSIAPDLLDNEGPSREALTRRLGTTGLSEATAARRASTLLSWRRYVLDRQGTLSLSIAKAESRPRARRRTA